MNKQNEKELSAEERLRLVQTGNLFCGQKFFTGLIKKFVNFIFETICSSEFIVFAIFSVAFFCALFIFDLVTAVWLWGIYAGVGIIFIVARSIRIVLEQKTTLAIQANATASVTTAITGSVSEILKTALNEIKKEKNNVNEL